MHRLLTARDQLRADTPVLADEESRHLRVLRPKDGEPFELFDGCGSWRICRYDAATRALRPTGAVETAPRPSALTLFACVTKGARWDWTLEKATELGATRIVPVISERTIVRVAANERAAKRDRWLRIVEEAARQSDAKWIPDVCGPVTFEDSLALVRDTRCLVGALTDPPPPPIARAIGTAEAQGPVPVGGWAVYVGPEGDFAPGELASLLARATPASFGTTILRAETAAIYGLSALKAHLDARVAASGQTTESETVLTKG